MGRNLKETLHAGPRPETFNKSMARSNHPGLTKDGGRVDQTASRPPGAGTMAASNIKTLKRPAQAYSRSSALDLWRHGETTTTEVPQLWPPEARSGRRGPRRISRDEQLVPAVGSGAPRTLQ
ncbi:unnamed protein product [Prorocentrum cordatum]|uniref:Uncharacterized protein n=1 Tax=Prorocentrum cordatum TaxID=2364126 RepID=A0ABN9R1H5_9DINO|nr:unnamed protein product [Polarella glacialis]